MKKLKIPLKDINNKQIYNDDTVEIDGLTYKTKYWDLKSKQWWFIRGGAGWIFNLNKIKVKKIN